MYTTFSNGGIRIFGITKPIQHQEVACYIPQIPEGTNGIKCVVDRLQGAPYILELNL